MNRQYGRRKATPEPPLIDDNRLMLYGCVGTVLVAFFLYLRTLAPGLHAGDGPELVAAAYSLGVPHPTGYPLYMLLGKFWITITGGGDAILRTTLLSALCITGAVGIWYYIVADAFRKLLPRADLKSRLILSAGGGLLVAFLLSVWSSATVTEVYALQLLLMTAFVRVFQLAERAPAARRHLILASILVAAGFAHHRISIVLLLPYLGLWWRAWRNTPAAPDRKHLPWVASALILLAGPALYAYLPIRAATRPAINWGNTANPGNLVDHIKGTEYLDRSLMKPGQGREFSTGDSKNFAALHTQHLLSDFASQGIALQLSVRPAPQWNRVFLLTTGAGAFAALVILGLGTYGSWLWFRRSRLAAGAALLIATQNVIITYAYNIADISDYCLFPWALGWVGLYLGAFTLVGKAAPARLSLIAYAGPALALLVAVGNLGRADRSSDTGSEVLASVVLPDDPEVMPEGSVLLTGSDVDTFAAWYKKIVRQARPDVLVFAGNFIWKSWYPAFFTPDQIATYGLRFAPAVARNPQHYVDQISHGVITGSLGKRQVFTSINDPLVLRGLAERYTLQPVNEAFIPLPADSRAGTTVTLFQISPKGA